MRKRISLTGVRDGDGGRTYDGVGDALLAVRRFGMSWSWRKILIVIVVGIVAMVALFAAMILLGLLLMEWSFG